MAKKLRKKVGKKVAKKKTTKKKVRKTSPQKDVRAVKTPTVQANKLFRFENSGHVVYHKTLGLVGESAFIERKASKGVMFSSLCLGLAEEGKPINEITAQTVLACMGYFELGDFYDLMTEAAYNRFRDRIKKKLNVNLPERPQKKKK